MKYAIINAASKQYKVSVGEKILIEKNDSLVGAQVVYDVLLIADGDKVEVGTPTLKEVVTAKVLAHTKGDKIRVATYKSKSRLRKAKGHRHQYTQIEILSIGAQGAKSVKEEKKEVAPAAKKPVVKKPAVKKPATPKKAK